MRGRTIRFGPSRGLGSDRVGWGLDKKWMEDQTGRLDRVRLGPSGEQMRVGSDKSSNEGVG